MTKIITYENKALFDSNFFGMNQYANPHIFASQTIPHCKCNGTCEIRKYKPINGIKDWTKKYRKCKTCYVYIPKADLLRKVLCPCCHIMTSGKIRK